MISPFLFVVYKPTNLQNSQSKPYTLQKRKQNQNNVNLKKFTMLPLAQSILSVCCCNLQLCGACNKNVVVLSPSQNNKAKLKEIDIIKQRFKKVREVYFLEIICPSFIGKITLQFNLGSKA